METPASNAYQIGFQHTAARRRLVETPASNAYQIGFQHTAARRRLVRPLMDEAIAERFNTQPPEGGWRPKINPFLFDFLFQHTAARRRLDFTFSSFPPFYFCFNTQPPEGGWGIFCRRINPILGFNTQPPEGGWWPRPTNRDVLCCFNTQPPEGGWLKRQNKVNSPLVSTHSRPKAAGLCVDIVSHL